MRRTMRRRDWWGEKPAGRAVRGTLSLAGVDPMFCLQGLANRGELAWESRSITAKWAPEETHAHHRHVSNARRGDPMAVAMPSPGCLPAPPGAMGHPSTTSNTLLPPQGCTLGLILLHGVVSMASCHPTTQG